MKILAALILPLTACTSISISSSFEAGSLGRTERVSETQFRCEVEGQSDQEGRNRQASWYYFRLDGARDREVEITLTNLRGEYNYRPADLCIRDDTPPFVSDDGISWRPLETISLQHDEATIRITPNSDSMWIAHLEPYPYSRLDRFLREMAVYPDLKDTIIGTSVEGRPIHLLSIGISISSPQPRRVVWLMCRQHAWESGTSFVCEGAIRFLLSEAGAPLLRRIDFKILPMLDPDGCARGGVRYNRNGYDLNRNWDSADPGSAASQRLMPEICAAKKALASTGAIFLTLHNQEVGDWLSGSVGHPQLAGRLFRALAKHTTFSPSEPGPRPPQGNAAPGRATVYEYLDRPGGMPAFILEQGITRSSRLGRIPTSKDRLEFGSSLAQALAEVASED